MARSRPPVCWAAMRESDYLGGSSRVAQVLAGIGLAAVALPFFLLGVFGIYVILTESDSEPVSLAVLAALGAFGGLCLLPAWRLISGRRRPGDGGLLSPSALRIGGLFFVVAPVVMLFKMPWAFLEAACLLGAGAACFTLARHREQRSDSPPEIAA